jgi:hypothetical protein
VTSKLPLWSERVEQELTCAVRANDVTARKAHLELAILHHDAANPGGGYPGGSRKSLTTALFTRIAFAAK